MFSNNLIAFAVSGLALIMSGAVIGQTPKPAPTATSGGAKAKSKKPVASVLPSGAVSSPVVGPRTTSTQYGADMLEGTNIKHTQPEKGARGAGPAGAVIPPGSSKPAANAPGNPAARSSRRKFDHIGNFSAPQSPGAGQTTPQFGADMMEGTNIRQKQPGNGGKPVKSPSGNITAQPKPGVVTHTAPQYGADMMEGSNIRQKQPETKTVAKPAAVKPPSNDRPKHKP